MQTTSFHFDAIGTRWQIDIPQETSSQIRTLLINEITELIQDFDKTYSRFRSDSLVTRMAKEAGTYLLPDNAVELLSLYEKLFQLTDHAFTPLIGQVLVDAGYDATYSLVVGKLQNPPLWEDVIEYTYPNIFLKQPALLDFGAAGKGYLIDLVVQVLEKHKITFFCVEAGGDMFFYNTHNAKLRVGLEHPDSPSQVIGVASIYNQSICASAGNRRQWKEFHHIVNPHTLSSPRNIKATWVVADTAILADGLATCLFFVFSKTITNSIQFSVLNCLQR